MKEFLKSPKITAVLGLIGGILMFADVIMPFYVSFYTASYVSFYLILMELLIHIFAIGNVICFSIILLRFRKKKININIANYILVVTSIVDTIILIFNRNIIQAILQMIISLYFINLFFKANIPINNKMFVVIVIVNIVIKMCGIIKGLPWFMTFLIAYIGYLLTVPYFYNYYNLLKGEKEKWQLEKN